MLIEMALELVIDAVTAVPRASVAAYAAVRNRQATRVSFGRARRVAIEDAGEGQAIRIRGRVELAQPGTPLLHAPVSGVPCAAWSLRIHRREVLWNETELLHLVLDASHSLPLVVTRGQRHARIAGPLVDLDLTPEVFDGRMLEDVPTPLARLLAERGLDETLLPGCAVHEHRLDLPAEAEVAGTARLRRRGDGYRGDGTELWLECLPSGHLPLRPA